MCEQMYMHHYEQQCQNLANKFLDRQRYNITGINTITTLVVCIGRYQSAILARYTRSGLLTTTDASFPAGFVTRYEHVVIWSHLLICIRVTQWYRSTSCQSVCLSHTGVDKGGGQGGPAPQWPGKKESISIRCPTCIGAYLYSLFNWNSKVLLKKPGS